MNVYTPAARGPISQLFSGRARFQESAISWLSADPVFTRTTVKDDGMEDRSELRTN